MDFKLCKHIPLWVLLYVAAFAGLVQSLIFRRMNPKVLSYLDTKIPKDYSKLQVFCQMAKLKAIFFKTQMKNNGHIPLILGTG